MRGLSDKILVMAAANGESMKIGGEGFLNLLNQSKRGAHWTNLFEPPRGLMQKRFLFLKRGVQTTQNALICPVLLS